MPHSPPLPDRRKLSLRLANVEPAHADRKTLPFAVCRTIDARAAGAFAVDNVNVPFNTPVRAPLSLLKTWFWLPCIQGA